jgi:hypothetical protein
MSSNPNHPAHRLEGNDLFAGLIAACIRNAMEDFHCDQSLGLTDDAMAKLNPVIRRAVWEALELMETGEDDDERRRWALGWMLGMIPDYWEAASTLPSVGCLP